MVRLGWVLVWFCAALPRAVTPYGIGVGCNPGRVQSIVDEVVLLADRSSLVLNEYVTKLGSNQVRDGAVRNILNAIIGTAAAGNVQAVTQIRGEWGWAVGGADSAPRPVPHLFPPHLAADTLRLAPDRLRQVVQGVGTLGSGAANLVIHCREVEGTFTYTPPPQPGQPPQPSIQLYAHPVLLSRIGGAPQQGAPPQFFSRDNTGQLYYLAPTVPLPDTDKGHTFVTEPNSNEMINQQQFTGSSVRWSDVALITALDPSDDPDGITSLGDVSNWLPERLAVRDLTLLDFGELPFVTLLHELVHSTVIIPGSIEGHGVINGEDANSISSIIQLAATNSARAADNPETFAFLALGK
ncbi:hypothetical protein GP486_006416 [Trichoglossum hirsutum]|uniref:Lysine-specific metallo-endopeptidase domain-containing protein n=1 Tax=Trichoglossum hirsutum TaxID=265104 RepID=A0A9P8IDK8_9PEZI|nr:hypothetical protein GP486_006416 [Trichoglossum hirsutum]